MKTERHISTNKPSKSILRFEDPITSNSSDQEPVNVYLEARREWNERYGSYIAREHTWRMVAFSALGIALVSVIGMVYLASQTKLVPYVVAVDKLGSAVAVSRADVAPNPDDRIIRAQLARWVENVRSVYFDAAAERAVLKDAYVMINRKGSAYTALNDYFRANDPFQRAKQESVDIQVESVLPISGNTWRVEWTENVRARDGNLISSQPQQASVTITTNPPKDEATLLRNPMGIYVTQFSWSQRL